MIKILWITRHLLRSTAKFIYSWPKIIKNWIRYWHSYRQYNKLAPLDRRPTIKFLIPCPEDNSGETEIGPIYFYQDNWAFQQIFTIRPQSHVDIGSHHKFVALLSNVVPVTMVDIRPWSLPLESVKFKEGSILNLPFKDASVPSVSSICVVEHIGLGRYGDPLDPFGSEKAIEELKRIVQPGGDLYITAPIDDENRTYFNAHRAFEESYLLELFEPFTVIDYRYIYGKSFTNQHKSGFGTGCYHLRKSL